MNADCLMDIDTNPHLHKPKRKRKKTIVAIDFESTSPHGRAIQVLSKLHEQRLQLAEAHAKQRPVAAEYPTSEMVGMKRYRRDCEQHYARAKKMWEISWAIEHAITTLKRCNKR